MSLGFITESTIPLKKGKAIKFRNTGNAVTSTEANPAVSLQGLIAERALDLEDQVGKKKHGSGIRGKGATRLVGRKPSRKRQRDGVAELEGSSNAGVNDRNRRDLEHVSSLSEAQLEDRRMSKLRMKAKLYEQVVAGRSSEHSFDDVVDFASKPRRLHETGSQPVLQSASSTEEALQRGETNGTRVDNEFRVQLGTLTPSNSLTRNNEERHQEPFDVSKASAVRSGSSTLATQETHRDKKNSNVVVERQTDKLDVVELRRQKMKERMEMKLSIDQLFKDIEEK